MSSLPSLWNGPKEPAPSRLWIDRESERKSGSYAAVLTFGLLLAVNAALLLPRPTGITVPLGDTPLTVEIRRLPPPPLPVAAPEPPAPETRKLLSKMLEPDRLIVPEPPAPPVVEAPKPPPKAVDESRPVKKLVKPKPKPKQQAEPPPAPVTAPASMNAPADASPDVLAGSATGHASGQPDVKPDAKGEILAALLHAVEANKQYPRQARRAGVEGKTVLKVTIGANGRVMACVLAEASGKTLLDTATEKLGVALVGLEIPPARGQGISVLIPVRYALKRS